MKNYKKLIAAAAILAAAVSCKDQARIEGTLTGSPDSQVVLKKLSGGSLNVIDTVKTASDGSYSYKMDIAPGQPEFVYIYSGATKVASLLLQSGDKVKVVSGEAVFTGPKTLRAAIRSRALRRVPSLKGSRKTSPLS